MGVEKGEKEEISGQQTGMDQSGVRIMRGVLVKDEETEFGGCKVGIYASFIFLNIVNYFKTVESLPYQVSWCLPIVTYAFIWSWSSVCDKG